MKINDIRKGDTLVSQGNGKNIEVGIIVSDVGDDKMVYYRTAVGDMIYKVDFNVLKNDYTVIHNIDKNIKKNPAEVIRSFNSAVCIKRRLHRINNG